MKIRKLKNRTVAAAAFTLVEMVIVLAIIGVLAAAVIVNVSGFRDDANFRAAEMGIDQLKTAILSYESNNYTRPPTEEQGLMALVEKPTSEPVPKRWRVYIEDKDKLIDPWGNEYQFRNPAQRSGKSYDLFSMGPDGAESEDDIGNW